MTPRQVYAASAIVGCATFAFAGLAMPFSDFARIAQRNNAAWWLESVGGACMVAGIFAVCFWFDTLRRLKAGEAISVPDHYRLIAFGLIGISLALTVSKDVFPTTKQFLDFAVHCFPLVMSYLFWSMWKENDVAPL